VRVFFLHLAIVLNFLASSAAGQAVPAPVRPQLTRSKLVISDLDGDFLPDLAQVEAGDTASGNIDYRIKVQLSSAGRQSIRLLAPAGGLAIEARDVNGDHAVDLVLSSVSLSQPVAIFINDGHGSFSRMAPSEFPETYGRPPTNLSSASDQITDATGLPSQSRIDLQPAEKILEYIASYVGPAPPLDVRYAFDFFLTSCAGRAPPA